jgi:hypothetical protein
LGGGTGVVLEIVSMHQVLYFDRNFWLFGPFGDIYV